jgi:hypothetical protein
MRLRLRFATSRVKLATGPALLLLSVGAAVSAPGLVDHSVHASAQLHASVFELPPQFELGPSCPVITVDPVGGCPLAAIPAEPWAKRATIHLCSESLCGSGFHPGDTILLVATRTEGSTFWRTVADRSGTFRSVLPAPLCRFAPVSLTGFDAQAHRSNRLSLATTGCVAVMP